MAWIRAMGGGSKKESNDVNFMYNENCLWEYQNNFKNTPLYLNGTEIKLDGTVADTNQTSYFTTKDTYDFSKYNTLVIKGSITTKSLASSRAPYISKMQIISEDGTTIDLYARALSSDYGSVTDSIDIRLDISDYNFKGKFRCSYKGFFAQPNYEYGGFLFNAFELKNIKPIYLYKDGAQNVAWDNSGYPVTSGWTCDGGFTFNQYNIVGTKPSATNHNICSVINTPIDMEQYSTLKAIIEYGGGSHIFSCDISSVYGLHYVVLTRHNGSSGCYTGIMVSSHKNNYNDNVSSRVDIINDTNVTITRVWLEK